MSHTYLQIERVVIDTGGKSVGRQVLRSGNCSTTPIPFPPTAWPRVIARLVTVVGLSMRPLTGPASAILWLAVTCSGLIHFWCDKAEQTGADIGLDRLTMDVGRARNLSRARAPQTITSTQAASRGRARSTHNAGFQRKFSIFQRNRNSL